MSEPMSLKAAERKAFRLNFKDGMLEIQAGLTLLLLGTAGWLGKNGFGLWVFLAAIALAFVLGGAIVIIKRKISMPRMGRVKYGQARNRRVRILHWIIFGLVILSILVVAGVRILAKGGFEFSNQGAVVWAIVIFFSLTLLAVFSGMAYFFDVPRILVYAIIIGAIPVSYFALQEYTELDSMLPLWTVGIFLVILGLILFMRFIRAYPSASRENAHDVD